MIAPKDNTPIDMKVANETAKADTEAKTPETVAPTVVEGTPNAPQESAPVKAKAQTKRIHFVNNGNGTGQNQRFTICVNIQPGRKAVMRLGPGSSARLVKAVSVSQADSKKAEEDSVTKWAHEISILKELGFKKTRACEVYLTKTKGDVGKAAEMMFMQRRKNEKKAKEDAKKKSKTESSEATDDAKEKEILEKQALLESQGFTCKRVTRNLLNRFDGDVEKVAALLTKRKAARQAKADALAATDTGKATMEEANVEAKSGKKVEEKTDTVKVTTFDETALREQLMKRFNGDEEKVNRIMNRRTEQANAKTARKKMMAAKQKAKQEMRAKKQAARAQRNARQLPQPVMMANPQQMLIA